MVKSFPAVMADPRCYVTTPYDMLVNQAIEDHRHHGRHGSCGVGFGETIERNRYPMFRLLRSDLSDTEFTLKRLKAIRDHWLPMRLQAHRIRSLPRADPRLDTRMLRRTAEAFQVFDQEVGTAGLEFLSGKHVIFEGAQGLALDMDGPGFPHVTRSNTGLVNVVLMVKVLRLELEVVYVTRAYLTRHGAGPLPGECEMSIVDETNVEHPYQGTLRFAPFDLAAMTKRIEADRNLLRAAPASVAITCLDQVEAPNKIVQEVGDIFPIRLETWGLREKDIIDRAASVAA